MVLLHSLLMRQKDRFHLIKSVEIVHKSQTVLGLQKKWAYHTIINIDRDFWT